MYGTMCQPQNNYIDAVVQILMSAPPSMMFVLNTSAAQMWMVATSVSVLKTTDFHAFIQVSKGDVWQDCPRGIYT